MRNTHYLPIAFLILSACGSSKKTAQDAAVLVDVLPFPDASIAADTWLVPDSATDPVPAEDTSPEPDTNIPADTAQDANSAGDDAAALACLPERLAANPPAQLSQTGCFQPGKPGHPIDSFFAYEVNSPLWSDGSAKSRYLLIPSGKTIVVKDCDQDPTACLPLEQGGTPEDEGHFDLPVGSILIKNFALQGKLIETRILVRASAQTWKGYSYEWNEEITEATLLDDLKDRTVGSQVWHYPSQQECLQCHTAAEGRSIGPTTRQLDRITTGGNQLDRLVALGLLPARPKALAPYADPLKAGPVEDRARSYLQANCAFCHRPGGPFSDLDLRYSAKLLDTKLCNVPILRGSGDPALPPLRMVPGKPEESNLSFRMRNRDGYPMPKIGSNLVDPEGVAIVDQWISGITTCPTPPHGGSL
jgi:uncharacterized repeat protein (TIGR03806 family)